VAFVATIFASLAWWVLIVNALHRRVSNSVSSLITASMVRVYRSLSNSTRHTGFGLRSHDEGNGYRFDSSRGRDSMRVAKATDSALHDPTQYRLRVDRFQGSSLSLS
jgi:hypothetical protein